MSPFCSQKPEVEIQTLRESVAAWAADPGPAGRLGRSSRAWMVFALVVAAAPALGPTASARVSAQPESTLFVDASAETGLDFVHWNGMSGEWYFPEINGAGAALFDYDNDGDLDIYLMQGALLGPGKTLDDALRKPEGEIRDRLLRNELIPSAPGGEAGIDTDGVGGLRFVDVTAESGIDARGYGMAVAAADFDNDGWIDLYLANFGGNQLWRNRGRGADGRITFEDVTEAWHAGDRRWSSAVAVLDFDRDGWLDLYLGNYLRFGFAEQKECRSATGQRDYCHPSSYPPEQDLLFRNVGGDSQDGNGPMGFADISAIALPNRGYHPTLGVIAFDADGDGWLDLYVANDDQPNQLWRNLGPAADGRVRFVEEALLAGCAVNGRGRAEASMGVDAADVDNDGDEDLFMT
ncbi:MAG: VCBS repeat-containing protein, partial [Holophagales bacterium]|nr:VCBS repeat-containing protein [Holophagales bacterium]